MPLAFEQFPKTSILSFEKSVFVGGFGTLLCPCPFLLCPSYALALSSSKTSILSFEKAFFFVVLELCCAPALPALP